MISKLIREVMCRLFCPGYLTKMPATDDNEWYVAAAFRTHALGFGREILTRRVQGKVAAYKTARWLALLADWFIVERHPEVGVGFGIRKEKAE